MIFTDDTTAEYANFRTVHRRDSKRSSGLCLHLWAHYCNEADHALVRNRNPQNGECIHLLELRHLYIPQQSIQQLFECLVRHGCSDLTSFADGSRSSAVIRSGGFGDVRRLEMDDGTVVALKTLRLHVLLRDDDKAVKV